MTITVTCHCPMCGKYTDIECDFDAYNKYVFTNALIQEVFPDMDIHTRETLISGMCRDCQESFFEEDDDDCDGECDVCCDFDCPSNASLFAPQE